MRSAKKRPKQAVFTSIALIFGLCLPGMAVLLPPEAEARVRIETGRDLHAACDALVAHQLNPTMPMSREARYCRQYLEGYFNVLRYLHEDEKLKRSFEAPAPNPLGCINIDGPRSWIQLAQQIVRTGDCNPQLMDEPAVKLAQKTFADRPPC